MFLVMVTVLAAEAPAMAYLDRGAGSMLLQVLLWGHCSGRRDHEGVLAQSHDAVSQATVK